MCKRRKGKVKNKKSGIGSMENGNGSWEQGRKIKDKEDKEKAWMLYRKGKEKGSHMERRRMVVDGQEDGTGKEVEKDREQEVEKEKEWESQEEREVEKEVESRGTLCFMESAMSVEKEDTQPSSAPKRQAKEEAQEVFHGIATSAERKDTRQWIAKRSTRVERRAKEVRRKEDFSTWETTP